MPQIIIKGVASEDIKNMSKELVSDLAVICDTTEDNFIFEEVNDSYYSYGEKTKIYRLVEKLPGIKRLWRYWGLFYPFKK